MVALGQLLHLAQQRRTLGSELVEVAADVVGEDHHGHVTLGSMSGTVEAIHISREHERLPEPVEAVEAVPGSGLRGDRYFAQAGGHAEGKDITLIEAEAIEGFRADTGLELTAAEMRRQVLTRGVGLNDLVGKRFRVGEVECVGRILCEPCNHIQSLTRPGVLRGMVHRGGLRADMLRGGRIEVGDATRRSTDEITVAMTELVCLLPARNCEPDLPGHLESVQRFADAVVALDDGSTDRTREILSEHPLVKVLLTNPPRSSYRGWDDAANRNRLLAAADELSPQWIMSLDADERIDPDDGAALRQLASEDAIPGLAYGFKVFRMVGDDGHYDRSNLWVYRLFAYKEGQRFPDQRLHFVPIPTSIPRQRWLKTTIRIQHLASLTEPRRRARFDKYLAADPEREFQPDYSNLLAPPEQPRQWEERHSDLPLLVAPKSRSVPEFDSSDFDLSAPVLSAIVISRDDEKRIESAVRAVVKQDCDDPFEVIVVTSGTDRTAEVVREKFPEVRVVELDRPALPGGARNAGVRAARGDYVSFPGSHVELPQGSLAARIRAHDRGYAMVTGTMLNGTLTPAGWASYFLDHSTVLPGRPSGELTTSPAHCSYLREVLLEVGEFPEDMRTGEDTVVNAELTKRGHKTYRAQDVLLVHRSPCRTTWRLVRHHFVRGRGLGRMMVDQYRDRGPLLNRRLLKSLGWRYASRRLSWTEANVERWGADLRSRYRRVLPLVVIGTGAAWAGAWYEMLRPARGKAAVLLVDARREPAREPQAG